MSLSTPGTRFDSCPDAHPELFAKETPHTDPYRPIERIISPTPAEDATSRFDLSDFDTTDETSIDNGPPTTPHVQTFFLEKTTTEPTQANDATPVVTLQDLAELFLLANPRQSPASPLAADVIHPPKKASVYRADTRPVVVHELEIINDYPVSLPRERAMLQPLQSAPATISIKQHLGKAAADMRNFFANILSFGLTKDKVKTTARTASSIPRSPATTPLLWTPLQPPPLSWFEKRELVMAQRARERAEKPSLLQRMQKAIATTRAHFSTVVSKPRLSYRSLAFNNWVMAGSVLVASVVGGVVGRDSYSTEKVQPDASQISHLQSSTVSHSFHLEAREVAATHATPIDTASHDHSVISYRPHHRTHISHLPFTPETNIHISAVETALHAKGFQRTTARNMAKTMYASNSALRAALHSIGSTGYTVAVSLSGAKATLTITENSTHKRAYAPVTMTMPQA